jgi:hypothetical protein
MKYLFKSQRGWFTGLIGLFVISGTVLMSINVNGKPENVSNSLLGTIWGAGNCKDCTQHNPCMVADPDCHNEVSAGTGSFRDNQKEQDYLTCKTADSSKSCAESIQAYCITRSLYTGADCTAFYANVPSPFDDGGHKECKASN